MMECTAILLFICLICSVVCQPTESRGEVRVEEVLDLEDNFIHYLDGIKASHHDVTIETNGHNPEDKENDENSTKLGKEEENNVDAPNKPILHRNATEAIIDKILRVNAMDDDMDPAKTIEGDILRSTDKNIKSNGPVKRTSVRDRTWLWHNRSIPYVLNDSLSEIAKEDIMYAHDLMEDYTCLKFHKRNEEKDYIEYFSGKGCYSFVGRQGGRQGVSIENGYCDLGAVLHEILHALGFFHEQMRYDRDKYIEIMWENIEPANKPQFSKKSVASLDLLGSNYDYDSLLHYGADTFSKNQQNTIRVLDDPDRIELGNSFDLSDLDKVEVNKLYDCTKADGEMYSSWSDWSPCITYRVAGSIKACTAHSLRFCFKKNEDECSINSDETRSQRVLLRKRECVMDDCKKDGHWGTWSSWLDCSALCGNGTTERTRQCDDPKPELGGVDCIGHAVQRKNCTGLCLGPDDCVVDSPCTAWNAGTNFMKSYRATSWPRSGPESDHTTGSGMFWLFETSEPVAGGTEGKIESTNITGSRCLVVFYHMHGGPIEDKERWLEWRQRWSSGREDTIAREEGNHGDRWIEKKVSFDGHDGEPYQIRMVAKKSSKTSHWYNDIAIDDIRLKTCGLVTTTAPTALTTSAPIPTIAPGQCGHSSVNIRSDDASLDSGNNLLNIIGQTDKLLESISGNSEPLRVTGGVAATPGSWPWQAAIYIKGKFLCGGSLISPTWVVTAGHCKYKKFDNSKYKVVLGDHDRSKSEGTEQSFLVKQFIRHPKYGEPFKLNNDIALIELATAAQLTERVNTVCLPKSEPVDKKLCYISGWGKMKFPGETVNILQQAALPVVNNTACAPVNNRVSTRFDISNKMVCAGYLGGPNRGGCHGDSGGPFVCPQATGRWVLAGAVSWGNPECKSSQTYTVFADVFQFVPWIESVIPGLGTPKVCKDIWPEQTCRYFQMYQKCFRSPQQMMKNCSLTCGQCDSPDSCRRTRFGCCKDGVRPAKRSRYVGCPVNVSALSTNFTTRGRWRLSPRSSMWNFTYSRTKSFRTGPKRPATSRGRYIYVESSFPYFNRTATMTSTLVESAEQNCFFFFYHMHGIDIGALYVDVVIDSGLSIREFDKEREQGPEWKLGMIDLPRDEPFKLVISVTTRMGGHGDVALDDFNVVPGQCPHAPAASNCLMSANGRCSVMSMGACKGQKQADGYIEWSRSNCSENTNEGLTVSIEDVKPYMGACLIFNYQVFQSQSCELKVILDKDNNEELLLSDFFEADEGVWETKHVTIPSGASRRQRVSIYSLLDELSCTSFGISRVAVKDGSC